MQLSGCSAWAFSSTACGILVSPPGIEPGSPALHGKFLTTGPPGKSLFLFLKFYCIIYMPKAHAF